MLGYGQGICFFRQQVCFLELLISHSINNRSSFFTDCVAVVMSELVKLVSCLWLVYQEEGSTLTGLKNALHNTIIKQPVDTLKVCVPSMIYVIQNNLLYVAASHLDAATYQVSCQFIFILLCCYIFFNPR